MKTSKWVWSVAALVAVASAVPAVIAGGGGTCGAPSSAASVVLAADMKPAAAEAPDIIGVATGANMENLTTLVKLVKAADLVTTLQGKGPFTVFAPTNDAFAKLPKETVEALLKPEGKEQLKSILLYHVVPANADAKTVISAKEHKTAGGGSLQVKEKDGKYYVGNEKGWAQIIKTDVKASNGVIHLIDAVVMP